MNDKLSVFELLQGQCRLQAIRALGRGWDANKRETQFLETYWERWLAVCSVLGIDECWWV